MSATKLSENIYSVGVSNPALRVFDIIMTAEYGTTYNAYLITGQKNVLIETVHERFFDEYIENISGLMDIQDIDYLIMNHTEPDHSGSVARLLKLNPNITVVASTAGTKFLTGLTNLPHNALPVKQGDTLDIGLGSLEFIIAPNLHWPDSMFTYFPAAKAIFTCDFLGAHYCEPRLFDTKIAYPQKYDTCFEYYYQCIFGPFKPFVLDGLDKIAGLELDICCTSHGPILTDTLDTCIEKYRAWSTPAQRQSKPKVIIAHASAYGYTTQLANAAYEELKDDYDAELVDIVYTPAAEAASKLQHADAVMIGSCTINRDAVKPVWDVLSSLDAINTKGTPAGVFGSYGWTGEAPQMICERLSSLKLKVVGEPLRVVFRPSEKDLTAMRAYARTVANNI